MAASHLRVLVVGAGIAGLAVARTLRLAGFRPEVTERSSPGCAVPEIGLYLPGNVERALREIGLDDPVRPLGQVIRTQRFLDAQGRDLCEVDLDKLWSGVGECRALPRSDLHRVLLSGAGGEVRYDTEVRALDLGRDAVTVTFGDGSSEEYDLVVGADGRRSAIRALAALGGPARPAGHLVYRGVVSGGPALTEWTGLLGERSAFVAVPMGAGRLHCYADEVGTAPPAEPLARIRELFAGYGGPVPAILDAMDEVRVTPTDEVELGAWSRGRVVLVGDAAHATAPTLAQGAAMALEDALVLTRCLERLPAVPEALERYESRRRPRIKWVQDRTRDRDRTRDVPAPLRDPLLRIRGSKIFQEHYRLLVDPA